MEARVVSTWLALVILIHANKGRAKTQKYDLILNYLGTLKNTLDVSEVIVLNELPMEIATDLHKKCQDKGVGIRFLGNEASSEIQNWLEKNSFLGGTERLVIVSHSTDITLNKTMISRFQWLLLNEVTKNPWLVKNLSLKSKVYVGKSHLHGHQINEMYSINGSDPIETHLFDIPMNKSDDGKKIPMPYIWRRRSDLKGITLLNALLNSSYAFNVGFLNASSSIGYSQGYFAEALMTLQTALNFNAQWVMPQDGDRVYGGTEANGSWTGLVGMLERREVDMSSATLTFSRSRTDVMDFSLPIYTTRVGPVVKRQSKRELNVWAYVHIFGTDSWIGVFLLSTLCVLLLTFTCRSDSKIGTLMSALAFVGSAWLQKGFDISCKSLSSKIICCSIWHLVITVFAYYSAVLTSLMTMQPEKPGINSYKDVLNSDYKVRLLLASEKGESFKAAEKGSAMAELYHKMMDTQETIDMWLVDVIETGLKKDEMFITDFIAYDTYLYEDHIFLDIKGMPSECLSFGFVQDSELTDLFSYHILHMIETGVFNQLYKKWSMNDFVDEDEMESHSLDYNNVLFPFSTLSLCIFFSVFILFFEISRKRPTSGNS